MSRMLQRILRPFPLAFMVVAALGGQLSGANRFFFQNQTLCKGQLDVGIFLRADVDQALYGFSFGINYDETALTVTDVVLDGTSIPPAAPDFFDGIIDSARGLIGYGCVLDFGAPFGDAILPGNNKTIAKLVVNVVGNPGSTQLVLETVPTNPNPDRPVKNVMTNDQGSTILPTLVNGTITIADCKANITAVANNEGTQGAVFQVTGQRFAEPGLKVEVCGKPAAAVLRGDGVTLDVTAPACASTGFAVLEVCNDYGCDTEANGFNYTQILESLQKPNDENQDGKFDLSDPVSILNHLFLGTNLSLPCGDGTTADPGNKALLDSNGDGRIDLSDAVHMLGFLFLGGATPSTCAGDPLCPCRAVPGCPDNSAKCQ